MYNYENRCDICGIYTCSYRTLQTSWFKRHVICADCWGEWLHKRLSVIESAIRLRKKGLLPA